MTTKWFTRFFSANEMLTLILMVMAFSNPWSVDSSGVAIMAWQLDDGLTLLALLALLVALGRLSRSRHSKLPTLRVLIVSLVLLLTLWYSGEVIHRTPIAGQARWGFWLLVIALGGCVWQSMSHLARLKLLNAKAQIFINLYIPALLGLWFITLWELVVVGFAIPHVLLPAPSVVGHAIASSLPMLAADFKQTVIRGVIPGFVLGNLVGFLVAVLADKVPFLRRGLLPVGNLVSAIPIVGIAPIMVMWFGFDWQSKVAVVVVMTFFPMLVNTIIGLAESTAIEKDLMRSYGATYWQSLVKLRLPNALPFVFNALKINSTLALIGAIVAEFFGTPIVGMGFRISTEVGRMNIEMVWASIAVAALAGSIFYGLLALLERRMTFWHASFFTQSAFDRKPK